jgi:alginate O-acetyltransferase complex protein AlgI
VIFTSYTYIAFLLLLFVVHWSVPERARKPVLVLGSYVFYCSWQWQFGFLLLGLSLFNWSYGRWVVARSTRRGVLALGIAANLAPLILFKYTGFLLGNVQAVLTLTGSHKHLFIPAIVLPIGISFFTFQGIAYLVDVAIGEPPFRRALDFLLYKGFWPQLIAGPIIRPGEIREQIEGRRQLTYPDVAFGCRRILLGFAKKIVLADMLAEFVDLVFLPGARPGFVDVVVAMIGFAMQIYFDFSAYSDIAIGSARLFGFVFPENFNWPYLAFSPQEFWSRWHMTLSRWIRDYVFTPLSFSQRDRPAMGHVSLIVAMAACGLWHGAKWTFVVWGVWHGLLLVANQTFMKGFFPRSSDVAAGRVDRTRRTLATLVTLLLVCLGWIFFRAQDLGQAGRMLGALATFRGGLRPMVVRENAVLFVLLVFLLVVLAHLGRAVGSPIDRLRRSRWAGYLVPVAYAAAIVAVVIFDKEAKAFVYFQF